MDDLLRVRLLQFPRDRSPAASIDEQYELADLVRTWTDKKKDWRMFTSIDDDDEEIGTKNVVDGASQIHGDRISTGV